uniref:Uncharacterized protein n=1 Tax=viral metagenome TaxID=1070528 RepID=A0A6H1ZGD9_9ZZZZ
MFMERFHRNMGAACSGLQYAPQYAEGVYRPPPQTPDPRQRSDREIYEEQELSAEERDEKRRRRQLLLWAQQGLIPLEENDG